MTLARFASFLVLCAALVVHAGSAHADDKRVLVFPLTGTVPGAPADTLTRLTQVIARSAGLTGAEVVVGQASFDDTAVLAGCASPDPACLSQVAQSLSVDHVVLGVVTPGPGGDTIEVALTAFVNGKLTQKKFTLQITNIDAMVEELAGEVPALFLASKRAEREPEPVAKPKPRPKPRPELVAPPPPPPESGFRGGRVSALSWVLAGSGLVAAGAGGVALVMARDRQAEVDGAPTATGQDLERLRDLEDEGELYTRAGNALLIGGGAALLVGGVIVLYQGYSGGGDERPRVSLSPMLGPAGAGVTLQVTLP